MQQTGDVYGIAFFAAALRHARQRYGGGRLALRQTRRVSARGIPDRTVQRKDVGELSHTGPRIATRVLE
jgi:hypothetical protein